MLGFVGRYFGCGGAQSPLSNGFDTLTFGAQLPQAALSCAAVSVELVIGTALSA
jgi:hypothetical protein